MGQFIEEIWLATCIWRFLGATEDELISTGWWTKPTYRPIMDRDVVLGDNNCVGITHDVLKTGCIVHNKRHKDVLQNDTSWLKIVLLTSVVFQERICSIARKRWILQNCKVSFLVLSFFIYSVSGGNVDFPNPMNKQNANAGGAILFTLNANICILDH